MATIDYQFQTLCKEILTNGKEYTNERRQVKRLQIPSYTFRHSFENGFPAITNKKLYWKGIVGELIWFLRGDNNVKYLNDNNIKIWNKDAYNWHKSNRLDHISEADFNKRGAGSVGRNYSVQWRNFNYEIDQIWDLIEGMKEDIMGSRLIVSAWNPAELDQTALPPCHTMFQIIGVPLEGGEFGFELHFNLRSWDVFLGAPYNIGSYALLAKILEKITGFKALGIEVNAKCVHLYENQYEAARELISRDAGKHPNCELELPELIFDPQNYKIEDFKLIGYSSDEEIKVDMIAPIKL